MQYIKKIKNKSCIFIFILLCVIISLFLVKPSYSKYILNKNAVISVTPENFNVDVASSNYEIEDYQIDYITVKISNNNSYDIVANISFEGIIIKQNFIISSNNSDYSINVYLSKDIFESISVGKINYLDITIESPYFKNFGSQVSFCKTYVDINISDIKVVSNPDGSGEGLGANTQEEGKTLYINFTHSIEGGITTVSPNLPFAVTKNQQKQFNITGTIGNKVYTKTINVTVNQFDTSTLQVQSGMMIGAFINYDVTYRDVYTKVNSTKNNGWRILDTGIDNGNGTYSGVKIVSTGIPAKLRYQYNKNTGKANNGWWGEPSQVENLYGETYAEYNDKRFKYPNRYAATGLYENFKLIPLLAESPTANIGYYMQINDIENQQINIANEFLKNGAEEIHNLTLEELNIARNLSITSTKDTSSSEGATGLFCLINLEKLTNAEQSLGYTSNKKPNYWLATPEYTNNYAVSYVYVSGSINCYDSNTFGLRPVISLPNNVKINILE